MWQRGIGGENTPQVSINEYRLANNSANFNCVNAYFMVGMPSAQSQYCYGYLINGVLNVLFNYANYNITVTYNNGTLHFQATAALPQDRDSLKIMYA